MTLYRVYSRREDEPYFAEVGTTAGTTFDTADPWVDDAAVPMRYYAVTSVKSGGEESFLSELYAVTTTKLSPRMSAEEAGRQLERYAQAWPILDLTPAIVLEATRAAREYRMPCWDALIWAAARLNQLAIVFTEDFQHGRVIEGIRFVNPFRPDFSLDAVRALAR